MTTLKTSILQSLKDGTHSDGNGLYFRVRNNGKSKGWVYRCKVDGKYTFRSLGSYPEVSLLEARARAKAYIAEPVIEKTTLNSCYLECLEAISFVKKWKSQRHKICLTHALEKYILPSLGHKQVDKLTIKDIYDTIYPLWIKRPFLGTKLINILSAIFLQLQLKGLCRSNPAKWKEGLEGLLPSPSKIAVVQHRAYLEHTQIPDFINVILNSNRTVVDKPLLFLFCTALRVSELTSIKWEHIKEDRIIIPAELRKGNLKEDNVIPITSVMKKIIDSIPKESEYLFIGEHLREHVRAHSLNRCLKSKYKMPEVTAHGFRTSFRNWAAENKKDFFASEMILSHSVGNKVQMSYLRTDFFDERKAILEEWNNFLFSKADLSKL